MDNHRPGKKTKISEESSDAIASLQRQIEELKANATKLQQEKNVLQHEKNVIQANATKLQQENHVIQANATKLQHEKNVLQHEKNVIQAKVEATSLMATLFRVGEVSRVAPIKSVGTLSSNNYPKKHKQATARTKEFILHYLYPALTEELKDFVFELNTTPSCYIPYLNNGTPSFATEADIQAYVNNLLKDATKICNILISKIAKRNGLEEKLLLETRAESSLFSNIIDHIVVYDHHSGTPILAVECKKFLSENIASDGSTNKVVGQAMDQLQAMRLMGHPSPFGVITCHNSSYITWLDSTIHDKIVESQNVNAFDLKRLLAIIEPLPATRSNDYAQSQSPIKIVKPDVCTKRTVTVSPESSNHPAATSNTDRLINISNKSYCYEKSVDLYINAIFCSLDGFFLPRSIISLEENEKVVVHDAIGMSEADYTWDTLNTLYRGPLTHDQRVEDPKCKLYLISYIGRGSTSKVYRCITEGGYGCVAKIYVQRRLADNKIMTEKEFQAFSDQKAANEFANLKNIYGNTVLNEYVWREKLNNLHCIIMPFFEPIETIQRRDDSVTSGIRGQLQRFGEKGKKFRRCDQLWRHVGYFQDQIFLFDLGDLIDIAVDPSEDDDSMDCIDPTNQTLVSQKNYAETFIDDHMARLAQKS